MNKITKYPLRLLIVVLFICMGTVAQANDTKYQRTIEDYTIPDVVLMNQNGEEVRFKEIMQSDRPVIVDFIFATCTAICPILSAGYASLQQKLGSKYQNVHLVSISLDPENDTPKVMSAYLKRYGAKPGWDFLTGPREEINKIMRAFNAYIPNKMYLYPLTLIRLPEDGKWVRIFGILSTSEFMSECQKAGVK